MNQTAKQNEKVTRYRPATDILEREDGFWIYMDMPGVSRDDMAIDLEDGELTVRGATSLVHGENERFTDMQFSDCEYVRSIAVSDIVDRDRIKASLENGVLELHLPRLEKIRPRKIEIVRG